MWRCPRNRFAGFEWSTGLPSVSRLPVFPGGDFYCVRDAFCDLMGWALDSGEGQSFQQAPKVGDVIRLAHFLGLTVYVAPIPPDADLAHPGLFVYEIAPRFQGSGHCEHRSDLSLLDPWWIPRIDVAVVDSRRDPVSWAAP